MARPRDRALHLRFLKRRSIGALMGIIILVAIASVVILIALAPTLLDAASLTDQQWSGLSALISVITLAFALGAGVTVLLQISEANDSRNLGIYRDIYEKMMCLEQIEARRFVYQQLPTIPDGDTDARDAAIRAILDGDGEARRNIKEVLNLIDYFGFLVEQDWVTSDDVIGWLSPVVVKVWKKIGPIVEYERSHRPEEPDYYLSAVNLAKKCAVWRDKNHPDRERQIGFTQSRL